MSAQSFRLEEYLVNDGQGLSLSYRIENNDEIPEEFIKQPAQILNSILSIDLTETSIRYTISEASYFLEVLIIFLN